MVIYNNTCCYGCSKSESEIEPKPTKLGSLGVLTCREMNKDSSTSRIGHMSILVNPQWLKSRIGSNRAPVILDVRWYRDRVGGYDHYLEHHIPNAIYVDLDQDLTGVHNPENGRRPFPSKEKVQELTRKWGIDKNSYVVVYDSVSGTSAARAWWILRDAGVENVFFLDGGLQRWEHAGMPARNAATRVILNITMLAWATSRVPITCRPTETLAPTRSSWTSKACLTVSRAWVLPVAQKLRFTVVPVTWPPTPLPPWKSLVYLVLPCMRAVGRNGVWIPSVQPLEASVRSFSRAYFSHSGHVSLSVKIAAEHVKKLRNRAETQYR